MSNSDWRVGDKAIAYGVMGTIDVIEDDESAIPIRWQSDSSHHFEWFTREGKKNDWNETVNLVWHSSPEPRHRIIKRKYYIGVSKSKGTIGNAAYRRTINAYSSQEALIKYGTYHDVDDFIIHEIEIEERE